MRWVVVLCLVSSLGCREEVETRDSGLRLLREDELVSYLDAEAALKLTGKSLGDIRTFCARGDADLQYELARFNLSIERFLEVAELVSLARHGRELFVDLPRAKEALARRVLVLLDRPEDGDLRERINAELESRELRDSEFVRTVLANAQRVEELQRRRRSGSE